MIALLLSALSLTSVAHADDNPVYNALKVIRNDIPNKSKRGVAEAIQKCSKELSVPWQDILAIAKVESNLKPKALRKIEGRPVDHGLFQINVLSIKEHKLDYGKILDPVYNTLSACEVIKRVKSYKKDWIGYYNVGPHSKKHKRRLAYEKKVIDQSNKIKELLNGQQELGSIGRRNLAARF